MMKFNTRVINGEVVLTSAVGCDEVAIIPSEVTVIDIGAFEGNKTLREELL